MEQKYKRKIKTKTFVAANTKTGNFKSNQTQIKFGKRSHSNQFHKTTSGQQMLPRVAADMGNNMGPCGEAESIKTLNKQQVKGKKNHWGQAASRTSNKQPKTARWSKQEFSRRLSEQQTNKNWKRKRATIRTSFTKQFRATRCIQGPQLQQGQQKLPAEVS